MASPTLAQAQAAVDFLNAWHTYWVVNGGNGTAPSWSASNGNVVAIVLALLGYYNGPVSGTIPSGAGSALAVAYYQFVIDYTGQNNNVNAQPLSAAGVPSIYTNLALGLQQLLAAEQSLQSGGSPSHSGAGVTTQNYQPATNQVGSQGSGITASASGGGSVTSGGGISGFLNSTTGKIALGGGLLAAAAAVAFKMKKK